jgi:hypothetical protein
MLRHNRRMSLAMVTLLSAFVLGGAGQAWAYDGNRNDYRDQSGNYQHYGNYRDYALDAI